MKQDFDLTLLDDVVISSRAATFGGHRSLDYLPGATLLGAAANRIYDRLGDDAYLVFHSGEIRFGDALPLTDRGHRTYPMPLCWQELKEGPWADQEGRLHPEHVRNYQHPPRFPAIKQHRPLRPGYFALDGTLVEPAHHLRMKTAIDPSTGRAYEGQLFGYASLPRGSRFGFTLSASAAVPKTLFDEVIQALVGCLRLGRSRSAEYGAVRISLADRSDERGAPLPLGDGRQLSLWLLSDLALSDPWGQPTLYPDPRWLELPPGRLSPAKSFLRSRSYAPFNSHYGMRELERAVLEKGGVLYFELDQAVDASTLARLQRGLGLYRHAGLGEVWVNPPLLQTSRPSFTEAIPSTRTPAERNNRCAPAHPLAQWIQQRVQTDSRHAAIETQAREWTAELLLLYRSAWMLAGVPAGIRVGPSPSQWGRVLELAKIPGMDPDTLKARLFEGPSAICKAIRAQGEETPQPSQADQRGQRKTNEWQQAVILDAVPAATDFRGWLQYRIQSTADTTLLAGVLAWVSRNAIDIARDQEQPQSWQGVTP